MYTSDLHFNHDYVARTRGFDTAAEHDLALILEINSHVTKRDHLWILGDVFMGSITEGLKQVAKLNGVKHLVIGNHDAPFPDKRRAHTATKRFLEVFESVQLHAQHRIGDQRVLLSHLPYEGDHADRPDRHTQWRLRDEGLPLLHGHVHDEWKYSGNMFNVGVDYRIKPYSQDEVAEWLGELSF